MTIDTWTRSLQQIRIRIRWSIFSTNVSLFRQLHIRLGYFCLPRNVGKVWYYFWLAGDYKYDCYKNTTLQGHSLGYTWFVSKYVWTHTVDEETLKAVFYWRWAQRPSQNRFDSSRSIVITWWIWRTTEVVLSLAGRQQSCSIMTCGIVRKKNDA